LPVTSATADVQKKGAKEMITESGKTKPYHDLQERFAGHPLGAPPTETFLEILKFYYEPEEAHLAAHMSWDLEPEEIIAKRAEMTSEEAAPILTRMASKFFIRGVKRPDGVRVFRLPYILPGLFELPFAMRQPSPELDKLGALWDKYYVEAWGRELHNGSFQVARALPAIQPPKERVVPFEDAVRLVEKASSPAIYPCMCRLASHKCDDPVNVCIVFGLGFYGGDVPGEPVLDPAHMVGAPQGRPASVDEVVGVLKLTERAGLVHTTANFQEGTWMICNCCRHACKVLRGMTQLDIPHAVAPSAYWVTVDGDLCNGCAACVDRCQVDAIRMSDDGIAEIDYERCLGCGICTFVCAPDALRLSLRDERVFTPALDQHEFLVMLGDARGRPDTPHHHPHV